MGRRPERAQRESAKERGASLVEFALVVPLLLAFLVGTVTGGIALGRSVSLNGAARETARYGALLPVEGDLNTWLETVADVAVASAAGDLDATASGQQVCVAYVYPNGTDPEDRTVQITEVAGVRTITPGAACMTDGRPSSERRVQVVLQRTSFFQTVFFSTDLNLDARSVARYERGGG